MLLFVNLDCVLAIPADALGPRGSGALGVRRLERIAAEFPALRVVVTGARRYRMTLADLRGFFGAAFAPRLIATTLLYAAQGRAPRSRLDEIVDWLERCDAPHADWLALDDRARDFARLPERLVHCETLTAGVANELGDRMRRRAGSACGLAPVGLLIAAAAQTTSLRER